MSSDASTAATTPPPRHSVFLSYASADRAAARVLRDTLEAAGLDVWLDEEELGGGEAWDAKIRNQIRTCTYFMPLISATTEVRREGYFRREWRLAVERTLDLADDVMFLLPVVIDDTRDGGARVPEKFFSVQWLRVPGGQATPALRELAGKLATGEAVAVHPPASAAPPDTGRASRKTRTEKAPPPPFPHFPPYPEHGRFLRFGYELLIWGGRVLHALWGHLPRIVRVFAAIVIVFNLISWIKRDHVTAAPKTDKAALIADVTKAVTAAGQTPESAGKDAAAEAIKSLVSVAADAAQSGRPIAVVNFSGDGESAETYADRAFDRTCELLRQGGAEKVSVSPIPLEGNSTDADALLRGARLKSQFVLTGRLGNEAPGQPAKFTAKLYDVKHGTIVWTESYDSTQVDATSAAERVANEVKQRTAAASQP